MPTTPCPCSGCVNGHHPSSGLSCRFCDGKGYVAEGDWPKPCGDGYWSGHPRPSATPHHHEPVPGAGTAGDADVEELRWQPADEPYVGEFVPADNQTYFGPDSNAFFVLYAPRPEMARHSGIWFWSDGDWSQSARLEGFTAGEWTRMCRADGAPLPLLVRVDLDGGVSAAWVTDEADADDDGTVT